MNYIVQINEESRGPVTLSDLQSMEAEGVIADSTYLREEESEAWLTWLDLKNSLATAPKPPRSFMRPAVAKSPLPKPRTIVGKESTDHLLNPVEKRTLLRKATAYPNARLFVHVIFYLLLVCVLISWGQYLYLSSQGSSITDPDASRMGHDFGVAFAFTFACSTTGAMAVWGCFLLMLNCLLDLADQGFQRK